MSTFKINIKKIGKYLRELSVVVVGIAITVSMGIWLNGRTNEKDLQLYLDGIRLELEQNVIRLDELITEMQRSEEYANYLKTHDKKSYHTDTIRSFFNAYYAINFISFKTNAFEMFKLSGTMRFLDDKDLLFAVWDAYTRLDELKSFLEQGIQIKLEEMKKELPLIAAGKRDFIPMYTYYIATPFPSEMHKLCRESSDFLQETISKIELFNPGTRASRSHSSLEFP